MRRPVAPRARAKPASRSPTPNRLPRSDRLAALGQLVAGLAHELNNPLQAVLGHLELLRASGSASPALRRDLRTVYREADRAAKIVRNLLVFAGSRRLVRRRLNLNTVIANALQLRASSLRAAGVRVNRHLTEPLPRLLGDALLLQQAFLNVVLNAEHAVAASRVPGTIRVESLAVNRGRMLRARIRDSGTGIPDEVLPHIFDPFFTTGGSNQGTGLGLAIAQGIVQEHGGRIRAGNHADGGAVFTIDLPIAASSSRG